ncbi:hypothetical protein FVE67_06010 [Thermosulfurimonas marina]|uniref:Uncharacterized protein n=1 Tax=Thermosulfurimonas marina TaxID=2047767 RepID=A0A6H1WT34_9BACT|nr:hypothetical protein [Thermosulfurimonas marina]QJA06385.1 hypothetical protein FVE67_06010 [Thermosulfurimonas marina]
MKAEDLFLQGLAEVRKLFPRFQEILEREERMGQLLKALLEAIERSDEAYQDTGAAQLCATCATSGRGTCCVRDMELSVSRELLLINLLVGVKLPENRAFPRGCFFLGPEGCLLKVRPLLCRNFFCPWFRQRFSPENLAYLQEAMEEEARLLFQAEDRLRAHLLKIL